MEYNTKMSDNKIENKINLKHIIDMKKINVSTYRYTSEYKKAILKTYMQNRYMKLYSKPQKSCQVTNAIVELVDIFPTIADLAGIPIPICQINNTDYRLHSRNIFITNQKESINPCSEGITLLPLIKNVLKCQVK